MDIDGLRAEIGDMRGELRQMREGIVRRFELLAGDDLDNMLESPAAAEAFLSHPDASRRIAALWLLAEKWPHDEKTEALLLEACCHDDDAAVRAAAIAWIGQRYSGSRDIRIGDLLASLVADEHEFPRIRKQAYRSLLRLAGTVDHPPLDDFDLDKEVDHDLVQSFLIQ